MGSCERGDHRRVIGEPDRETVLDPLTALRRPRRRRLDRCKSAGQQVVDRVLLGRLAEAELAKLLEDLGRAGRAEVEVAAEQQGGAGRPLDRRPRAAQDLGTRAPAGRSVEVRA